MSNKLAVWSLVIGVGSVGIASTFASATPTRIQPGPTVQPGQVVTVQPQGYVRGRWAGPQITNPKLLSAEPLMTTFKVRGNTIEEFTILGKIFCEDTEDGRVKRRELKSNPVVHQNFIPLDANGKADVRVPLSDTFRWMEAHVRFHLTGNTGKVWVHLVSTADPQTGNRNVDECTAVNEISVVGVALPAGG